MANTFIFKRNQTIGAAAAELDGQYLAQCFVDNGDLGILRDTQDARRIVLGRTGSGKSALLLRLAEVEDNVIRIEPESLSLTYISNSNILRFFSEAGVKMDIFYRLLWRHVLVVELLKKRFRIESEQSKRSFLENLWRVIPKTSRHEAALDYLRTWGESFWKETEYRVKEIATTFEKQLEATLGANIPGVGSLNVVGAKHLTEEQKEEVVHRAQDVVSRVQIRELTDIIHLIGELLLNDPQQRYYVTIDRLDTDWVEENLRFRLIRALIETSLDFASNLNNVKIIVAIRSDLLDRVYRYTRDPGFQEEKYRTSTLNITWSRDQLANVLDSRIDLLVRQQYTRATVTHADLLPARLPANVGKNKPAIDYMLDRTLMRPRDIISFFNMCIAQVDGKATISAGKLFEAEGVYSRERLRALADEWYTIYPNLFHLTNVLKKKEEVFAVGDLALASLEESCLHLLASGEAQKGIDHEYMQRLLDGAISSEEYRKRVVLIFYRVGLVGLKTEPYFPISWSFIQDVSVSEAEIEAAASIHVHPTFWRALGIVSRRSGTA